ncbi:MAG TPA: AmmeMemoRadiSam system protein A [Desulfobacteria bacterium]|nr:AmmeMemoRadiSam system protein A [Desulfobacteria bacterium]
MGKIVFCGIMPHPPIVLPEVGGTEAAKVKSTFEAMESFAKDVAKSGAEVIVMISPHGPVFSDGIAINGNRVIAGDLMQFKANLEFDYINDMELVREIINRAGRHDIVAVDVDDGLAEEYGISTKLDHGVLVPMYFLDRAGVDLPIVSVAMGMLPFEELYAFGAAVQEAVSFLGKKAAVIASGDMSHRLTPDAPAGFSAKGRLFDEKIVELLKDKDYKGIINIDRGMAEEAGECGLRTIIMMLGATDGNETKVDVLSYEGPFGVGYMVAQIVPLDEAKPSLLREIFDERKEKVEARRAGESTLVSIARAALEAFVIEGRMISPETSADPLLDERAGVFVSIKKHGQLRGCIGTIHPTRDNIASEIVNNAISSGTGDPRFEPVEPEELDQLVYSVDVLKAPEPINTIDQLDVKRYGVIVKSGRRSGLLLPNLEGVDTVQEQVSIARQKAGIGSDEAVQLERFEVVRYQ